MADNLGDALRYLSLGWNIVYAPIGGKSPTVSWKRYQSERVVERLAREWFADRPRNIFIITGKVSRLVVLDCDNEATLRWWRNKLGDALDATACVKTRKGYHFYFRLPPGVEMRNQSYHDGEIEWDIRGDGGGVIAPPSVHETGFVYEWVDGRGPEALQDIPAELLEQKAEKGDEEASPRSLLNHLLNNVPAEGGRNVWLAQVAGHYARHVPYIDAFETMVRDAAAKLSPPLPEDEIAKLIKSIWQAEQAKEGRAPEVIEEGGHDDWRKNLQQATDDTGWLVSGGTRILCQTISRDPETKDTKLSIGPWLDCDIRVLGVVDADTDQVYGVELRFPDGHVVEDHLPAAVISDGRRLSGWLARHGASIGPPDNIYPSKMRETTRLLRYLRSQGAEPMIALDHLGWHAESKAFITHDGIIRSSGPAGFEHVRPDPRIKGWAPYRYGHGGRDEARAILREILTFHHRRVAAVFGAWSMSVLLKPQIQERVSQFPFMALEASSESGKTTGFFSLLLQLLGSRAGQSNPTRAALRDLLSANNNGVGWVDDRDDLDELGELLRNVTVGGSMVKKGAENHEQVVAKMRAALVVSGESLGLHDQKALIDRAVLLDVPSPTGRRSLKGDYPQWDDIVKLRRQYPDLTEFAGSIVELALAHEAVARGIKQLRRGSGRHADTIAVVRCGARVLSGMLEGEPWVVDEADAWAEEAEKSYSGRENVLTLSLIPLALRSTGWKRKPEGPMMGRGVATPAFIDENMTVWFSPRLLAEWREKEFPRRRLNARVESAIALEQQARELNLGGRKGTGRKDFRLATGEGSIRYWNAADFSAALIRRSRDEDGVIDEEPEQQELPPQP